ncbi:unnamed protein product [Pedinophyceae sp. YPF-701]|nr:unnamed protein product [Pedinophyceae sp. YPF-701]
MAPKTATKTAAAGATAGAKKATGASAGKTAAAKKPAPAKKAAAGAATKTGAKKGATKKSTKSEASKYTDEQKDAAVRLQAAWRGFSTRKNLADERKRKAAMEVEIEELRQKAWLIELEYNRKKEKERAKKAAEEARRKREAKRITEGLLDAAFDGEVEELEKLLREGEEYIPNIVDAADGHGNTLLSEASAGGSLEAVRLLLARGANPNTQGEFKRSPLFRACFMGKTDVILPLLEAGADPRVPNEFGERPEHIGSDDSIKALVANWDLGKTDALVAAFEERKAAAAEKARKEAEQRVASKEDEVGELQRAHDADQKALAHAHTEYERRVFEYDTSVEERRADEILKAALASVKEAEEHLKAMRDRASLSTAKLQDARMRLREERAKLEEEHAVDAGEELEGRTVEIKELNEILILDVGGRLADPAHPWPFVLDPSKQASVFLRYADTNYINMLSPYDTEVDRMRRAILGGFRYGKPVVFDVMDVDLGLEGVKRAFEAVQPGLFQDLVASKELLKDERYLSLRREGDGPEYADAHNFQDARVANFRVIFLSSARHLPTGMDHMFDVLRVAVKK